MSKLLQFNPDKRITAEEALRHPYVAQFHNEADEPSHPTPITIPIDDNHKVLTTLAAHPLVTVCLKTPVWAMCQVANPSVDNSASPSALCWPALQYSIEEYREKLYMEIVKRRRELREARRAKERASGRDGSHHRRHRHRSSRTAEGGGGDPAAAGASRSGEHRSSSDHHRSGREHRSSNGRGDAAQG